MNRLSFLLLWTLFTFSVHASHIIQTLDAERVGLMNTGHDDMGAIHPLTHRIHGILAGEEGIDLETHATPKQRSDFQRAILLSHFIEKNSFCADRVKPCEKSTDDFIQHFYDRLPQELLSKKGYEGHVNTLLYMHGTAYVMNTHVDDAWKWDTQALHEKVQHFFENHSFPIYTFSQATYLWGASILDDFCMMLGQEKWVSWKLREDFHYHYNKDIDYESFKAKTANRFHPLDRRWNVHHPAPLTFPSLRNPVSGETMDPLPKSIHYIWVGGPIKEAYWQGILKTATDLATHDFVVNVWTDTPKNIQRIRQKDGAITYQDPAVYDHFFEPHGAKTFSIPHKTPYLRMRHVDSLRHERLPFFTEKEQRLLWSYMDRERVGLHNFAAYSDYLRYIILYLEGGTYMDTDITFKGFDESQWHPILKTPDWLEGFAMEVRHNNCIIQCQPHHVAMERVLGYCLSQSIGGDYQMDQWSPSQNSLKDYSVPLTRKIGGQGFWHTCGNDLERLHMGAGPSPRRTGVILKTGPSALCGALQSLDPEGKQLKAIHLNEWVYNGLRLHSRCDNTWLKSTNPSSVTLEDAYNMAYQAPRTLRFPWRYGRTKTGELIMMDQSKKDGTHQAYKVRVSAPETYPLILESKTKLYLFKSRWFPEKQSFLATYMFSTSRFVQSKERFLTKLWVAPYKEN